MGVSDDLYHFIHDLWLENQPIGELSWQTYALDFGASASQQTKNSASHKENNVNAANELPCSANLNLWSEQFNAQNSTVWKE